MVTIESSSNSRVKQIKRLQSDRRFRRREGLFVIETNRWLQDALAGGHQPTLLLYSEAWAESDDGATLLAQVKCSALSISPSILRSMSRTETPVGFVATVPMPAPALPTNPNLLLILDQLRDPGNLGTIIRAASAASVDAILLTPGSVDPYNPKVVRATMGTLLRLPVVECKWKAIAELTANMDRLIASGAAATPYDAISWEKPAALIVGSEADGPSAEAQAWATKEISIPMANGVESLNAAVASSIILFEAARQRRRR